MQRPRLLTRRGALFVAGVLVLSAGMPRFAAASEPPPLEYSTDDYFGSGDPDFSAREITLLESEFVGVALQAPPQVDTTRRDSLPLILAARYEGIRDWELPITDNAVLVAIDLERHDVLLAPAFQSGKRRELSHTNTRPADAGLAGFGAQITRLDARAPLGLPWRRGRWAVALLYHDWRSNLVIVDLVDADSARGQGVAPVSESEETGQAPQAVANIRLLREPGKPIFASGDFKLTSAFVLPVVPEDDRDCGRATRMRSVLPATLLILTANQSLPQRFDWAQPVSYSAEKGVLWGEFTRDLPAVAAPDDTASIAYFVVGGHILPMQMN